MIPKAAKRFLSPILQRMHRMYFSSSRTTRIKGLKIIVLPGVFPPHYVLSSKIFLNFIQEIDLRDKTVLDLGSGCGILSVAAAKQGAAVTAIDVNETAVINTKLNAEMNEVTVNALRSDFFQNTGHMQFDYVLINPPYYPKQPMNDTDKAWFCGDDFQYFKTLFKQLSDKAEQFAQVFMILSEDCEINRIQSLAENEGFQLKLFKTEKSLWETNYIFNLKHSKFRPVR